MDDHLFPSTCLICIKHSYMRLSFYVICLWPNHPPLSHYGRNTSRRVSTPLRNYPRTGGLHHHRRGHILQMARPSSSKYSQSAVRMACLSHWLTSSAGSSCLDVLIPAPRGLVHHLKPLVMGNCAEWSLRNSI